MESKTKNDFEIKKKSVKDLDDKIQENENLLNKKEQNSINAILVQRKKFIKTSKYGNNFVLMFLKNEPFIVIGPNCKF